jgi:PAS domain S-box-containing protein
MKILIVDDDAADRALTRSMLNTEGHTILEASDGVEGLEVLQRENVNVVISDVFMPRMDGYRFCYEVRTNERLGHVPFILVSGYSSPHDSKRALEMGADHFATKTCSASELIQALHEVTTRPRPTFKPVEPAQELSVMKEYNQQLVEKLEQKNVELSATNQELLRSREALTLFRNLIDHSNDSIEVIDPATGRFLDINQTACRGLGYGREEMLLLSLPDIVDRGGSRFSMQEAMEALRPAGYRMVEARHRRKDGSTFPVEVNVRYIQLDRDYMVAVVRDIIERKRAEEERERAARLMQLLLESAGEGIYGLDTEGRCTFINRAGARMLGYQAEELLGRNMHNLAHHHREDGSVYPIDECPIFRAFRRGEHCWVDTDVFWRADGSLFPVEYNSCPIVENGITTGAVVTVSDITERRRAEEQIAEQAALLNKARDAIVVRDIDGKVLFWNKGAEFVYGWNRDEALGRNVAELYYADSKKFEEINALTTSRGEWQGEVQHLTKHGREITLEARWTLIRDKEGRPKSVLAINTDITERKKIEAQFMRAQRMESIGTLAGGVAHDLNNILAPIMMAIQLLKEMSDDPGARKILETLDVSARRGADIVRQVLSFARGLEGQRIEIQPQHVLKDLGTIIRDTFPKNIRFHFSVADDVWSIVGDPTQVHQVLLNLCVNARDAMPNGGDLTISVENSVLDEQYAAMNLQGKPGQYVNISVTDSGTGMTPEVLDKIFEPFFTTKSIDKGTGLGLSTVMAIVKSHEGLINVYSERGKGTTFKVYLPAMLLSSEAQQEHKEENSLPRGDGETVLVIEDEASILTITSQTLQAFGYRVLTAMDGAEALAIYAQKKDEIAVVLTDMMMPILDGPATIRALLRLNPKIKIVAVSGLNAKSGVVEATGGSVKHVLTKPYTAGTLLKTLRAILDEA